MKFKIKQLSFVLIVLLYFCLIKVNLTTSTENNNSNMVHNKASIFESFQTFDKLGYKINIKKFSKAPVNPFDPNGKPLELNSTMGPNGNRIFNVDSGEIDLGNGPVYFEGWVKFFRFLNEDKKLKLKAFFRNPEFIEQFKGGKTVSAADKIADPNNFWLMLFRNSITFIKSKTNKFQTVYDSLKVSYISPVSEDPGFHGGITNVGSFKEGECFKVSTNNAGKWNWIICSEKPDEKIKLMTTLKKIVMKKQRENGLVATSLEPEKKDNFAPGAKPPLTLAESMTVNDPIIKQDNLLDGYWIILQDWSTCTKFCGGGTQTLQRLCVPPKPGGKACVGQNIVTKVCNEQTCPNEDYNIITASAQDGKAKIETIAPTLQVLPFSDRPQRYDKCHLKESDLLMTISIVKDPTQLKGTKTKAARIPVRVVMNKNTITAYAGMNETDMKVTFDIQRVNFMNSIKDKNCFIFKETGEKEPTNSKSPVNQAEFCPFGLNSTTETKEEWDYDFNLFKYQCFEPKQISDVHDDNEMKNEIAKKKKQLKIDLVNKKKKKLLVEKDDNTTSYTKKIKEKSIQAISKELKLEQMLENEVKESQQELISKKANELEKEKHKLDCLNKAVKEKELETEFNVAQSAKEERINSLKKEVADTINVKRARLKKKIAKWKKLSDSTIGNYDAQIINVRLEMMNSLQPSATYNPEKCKILVTASSEEQYEHQRKIYCDDKLSDDPDEHSRCLSANKDDILALCCDYETNPENSEEYKKCMRKPNGNGFDDVRFFWAKPFQNMLGDNAAQPAPAA